MNNFNPETLEGVSYILYVHPDTGQKSVSSWPTDGSKAHRWFTDKYPDVTVLAMGIMEYNAKEELWLPTFENGCDRARSEKERIEEIAFVSRILNDRYAHDERLKTCLGEKFEQKMATFEQKLVHDGLPARAIEQKIRQARTKIH